MQNAQPAFTPRNNAPLFASSQSKYISDAAEIISLTRHFAFSFADTFGADRAIAHICQMLDRMVPLINLRFASGTDEKTECCQTRGIQEILCCVRGTHDNETKLSYVRKVLNEDCWRLAEIRQ